MECKYWVLAVRWGLDWVETHILRPGYVAVELGWSWGAILLTWMDVRHEMDGCEMPTSWPGCNMNWRILGHGWMWNGAWGAWMQVRQDMNGSKTHVMIPGWVSDWTWMDKRCSFQDPHEGETWPGWRWDTYIETCIELNCDLDGCETLISRHISMISTHLHPGDKSPLSKFQNSISVPPSTHINAIQVLSLSKSYLTYIWVLVSTLYTYHLIFIMVPRLSSLLHPFTSHLHPSTDIRFSPPSRLGITSIQLS